MKKLLIFLICMLPLVGYSVDTEVQDLTAITSPALGDILYIVDDPTGTPASRKITIGNTFAVANDLDSSGDVSNDSHDHTTTTLSGISLANDLDAFSSANLLGRLSDETGSGLAVFGTSPTFITSIIMGAATLSEAELEILDGATLSTAELNYVDGVTSAIQTQLDAKEVQLDNEAGLYAVLSDVSNFLQTGDALAGGDITDGTINFPEIKYDNTLAGNPTLAVDECYPFADASGGGFICEGSTANTNEQIYRFPNVDGADTDENIAIAGGAFHDGFSDFVADEHIAQGTIDHGSIAGLSDDDHSAYENELTNSAGLLAALDDETGTGLAVFNASPTITGNIVATLRHLKFTIFDPNAVQADDTQVCIWPETDAALTVTKITVTLDSATNQVAGDLKYADTFIGLASATVINDFDTTSGVREDDTITSGAVAAGKAIYIQFDSQPNAAITQMCIDVIYDYD